MQGCCTRTPICFATLTDTAAIEPKIASEVDKRCAAGPVEEVSKSCYSVSFDKVVLIHRLYRKGVADEQLAKIEQERGRKRERPEEVIGSTRKPKRSQST